MPKTLRRVLIICALVMSQGAHAARAAIDPAGETTRVAAVVLTFSRPATGTATGHEIVVDVVYPNAARGPLPLVIYNHGFRSVPIFYMPFLEQVARYGYVVAAPRGDEMIPDPERAADVRFVTSQLIGATSGLPRRLVNPDRIGAIGYSLGGTDSYGLAYNSCCRDRRIRAVATFSAPLLDYPTGQYIWRGAPLLIAIGDADPLVPYTAATTVFHEMQSPVYLLTIHGGGHGAGTHADDLGHAAVATALRRFLDGYLKRDRHALTALRTTRRTDVVSLRSHRRS